MDYIGEKLGPGQLGHFLIILSFVSSLIAAISYFISSRTPKPDEQESWKRIGRISFFIDVISVLGVFIILYSLIANHRYEYQYVFKNSGNDLEPKYILSSLWSASEGSFILWTVWHAILGVVIIATSKKWEAPVMSVLSFAQVCLATMMLGLHFWEVKIGSNPFALFREQMPDLPVFQFADYATRIKDGNGLNMLLQNYWMVIHPPVLFLGFASTIIPFAFAMGGLITKKYGDWVKPALPWALFSACVLGVGIMMGGAWAYESLSFGGYWAWDPVENASLVPWLTLIAGIHTLVIYKSTGRSLQTSFFLIALTFILILYSTFLTRSGILGETSVHSFADLGMNTQLFLFLYAFVWMPTIVSIKERRGKFIALFSLLLLSFIILFIFKESISFFKEVSILKFISGSTWNPLQSPDTLSILNIILGTIYVSIVAIFIALPIGVGCAVLLAGYMKGTSRIVVRGIIDVLAGVPSVIYGFIGLMVLIRFFERVLDFSSGESVLVGGILLSLMVLPYIISTCDETMEKIYTNYSPSSKALGIPKSYMIRTIILPQSLKSIIASIVLALGRAMGETMAVMMVIGNAPIMPKLLGKCQTIPSLIALEMGMAEVGSLHYHSLFAAGFVLMAMLLIINIGLYYIKRSISL